MKNGLSFLIAAALVVAFAFVLIPGSASAEIQIPEWEKDWNRKQPPEKVMDSIGIKPGMTIAEIGAGTGRYAIQVSMRVGEKGKVYANDIDSSALKELRHRCKRDGINNIETVLGTLTDPKLPKGKIDFIFFINTYHHIDQPVKLLKNAIAALKPNGKMVIIEHTLKKSGWINHSTPKETVLKNASDAGLTLIRIETF
jgi:ubiquinone/menaquinone biosynthesis C-methylase UbiE